MKSKKVLAFLGLLSLAACQATPVVPEASRIRIVTSEPKICDYLGEVTGKQGDSFTGGWTSNANLETGARNDMKNQASKMGGNVIQLLTNRAGQTGHYGLYGGSTHQTDVVYAGAVYRCGRNGKAQLITNGRANSAKRNLGAE